MELLGLNLVQFTQSQPNNAKKLTTAKALSTSLLSALSSLHQEGFHHRDIKPANIVLRPQKQQDRTEDQGTTITPSTTPPTTSPSELECILIDFGLARRFIDADGIRLPERHDVPFKGSSTYASLYALQGCDQGPRDDIWGWFYLTVELVTGCLPWRFRPAADGHKGDDNGATPTTGNTIFPTAYTKSNAAANKTMKDRERYSKTEMIGLKSKYIDNPAALALLFLGEDVSVQPPPSSSCSGALVAINKYLKRLSFDDDIDYDVLRRYVDTLDDPKYIITDDGDEDGGDGSLSPVVKVHGGGRYTKEEGENGGGGGGGGEMRPKTARSQSINRDRKRSRSSGRDGRNRNGEEERGRKRREESRERERDRGGRRWYDDGGNKKKRDRRRSRSRSRSASRRRRWKREGGRDDQKRKKRGRRGGSRSKSRDGRGWQGGDRHDDEQPLQEAANILKGLDGSKSLGAVCWLLEEVGKQVESGGGGTSWLTEVAAFATMAAAQKQQRQQDERK